jgi:hypothetical protein
MSSNFLIPVPRAVSNWARENASLRPGEVVDDLVGKTQVLRRAGNAARLVPVTLLQVMRALNIASLFSMNIPMLLSPKADGRLAPDVSHAQFALFRVHLAAGCVGPLLMRWGAPSHKLQKVRSFNVRRIVSGRITGCVPQITSARP